MTPAAPPSPQPPPPAPARRHSTAQTSPDGTPADSATAADALLVAAAGGCKASFEALYRLTSRRLYGVVLRITRDRGEAEDVLQAVYLKAWRDGHLYNAAHGSALQWLAVMARHRAIDSLRRLAARPQAGRPGAATSDADAGRDCYTDLPCPNPDPLDKLIDQRRATALHQCLAALPDAQRHSLTLAFFNGLSHPEVAAQMDRPLGTVKSWVRRALLNLRVALPEAL